MQWNDCEWKYSDFKLNLTDQNSGFALLSLQLNQRTWHKSQTKEHVLNPKPMKEGLMQIDNCWEINQIWNKKLDVLQIPKAENACKCQQNNWNLIPNK